MYHTRWQRFSDCQTRLVQGALLHLWYSQHHITSPQGPLHKWSNTDYYVRTRNYYAERIRPCSQQLHHRLISCGFLASAEYAWSMTRCPKPQHLSITDPWTRQRGRCTQPYYQHSPEWTVKYGLDVYGEVWKLESGKYVWTLMGLYSNMIYLMLNSIFLLQMFEKIHRNKTDSQCFLNL